MERAKRNKRMLFIELTISALFFLFFLYAAIQHDKFSEEAANLIYIGFVTFIYAYIFVFEYVLPKYDIAVHYKRSRKHYVPTGKELDYSVRYKRKGIKGVIALWLFYLAFVWCAKILGLLTWQVFLIGASVMFALNSIFTRCKCYLSVWFLKNTNHCCKNCGINGWDYAIFASALIFAPYMSTEATVINAIIMLTALIRFIQWEYLYHKYPFRFYPETNRTLWCDNCQKQCKYRINRE